MWYIYRKKLMEIKEPYQPEEFQAYFKARWEFLRKPHGFPKGSEIDDFENISLHVMAVDSENVVGVARLTYRSTGEGQIRYMGVDEKYRNKNIGHDILIYLENEAVKMGLHQIFLNARKDAIPFYKKNKYLEVGDRFKGFADIEHVRMEKHLLSPGA